MLFKINFFKNGGEQSVHTVYHAVCVECRLVGWVGKCSWSATPPLATICICSACIDMCSAVHVFVCVTSASSAVSVHMSKEQWAVVSLLLCMWRHVLCLCVSLCTGATAGTNVAFACCFPRLVHTSAVPVDRSQTTLIALVCVCTPWPGAVSVCVWQYCPFQHRAKKERFV